MDVQVVPIIQFLAKHYGRRPSPSTGFCSCISLHTSAVCLSSVQYIPIRKTTVEEIESSKGIEKRDKKKLQLNTQFLSFFSFRKLFFQNIFFFCQKLLINLMPIIVITNILFAFEKLDNINKDLGLITLAKLSKK